jgi:hypothetical protein
MRSGRRRSRGARSVTYEQVLRPKVDMKFEGADGPLLTHKRSGRTGFRDLERNVHHGPACEGSVAVARHRKRNVAGDDRINELRRLQAAILRCWPRSRRAPAHRRRRRHLHVAVGGDLFEVVAPAARAAEQHQRQVVQGRKRTVRRDTPLACDQFTLQRASFFFRPRQHGEGLCSRSQGLACGPR